MQDFLWRRQVLDFVAQYFHAPVECCLVDGLDHLGVDDVALFKGFVEFELADHTAQRGLRQLGDGHDVVGRAVAGAHGVGHLKVQDAVHLQLGVVAGDADLAGHVERDFFQAVLVSHLVHKWHQKVQARRERAGIFAQPLFHPGVLLRHDLDGARDKDDGNDKDDDGDFHENLSG